MIKDFEITDLGYFLPNEHSDPDRVLVALRDPNVVKVTLWHDGMVAAILAFRNYWGSCWDGFFLIAADFPDRCAVMLKRYVRATMEEKNATRLQTDSVACDMLRRWHEWLGFKLEGTREKVLYNRDYDMWALMRAGGA